MAIIKGGILGGISKKIGSVVGYRLNGQDVLRSLPAQYNDKNSLSQQKQRSKLTYFVSLFRLISFLIRSAFPTRSQRLSAYNAFVSQNKNSLSVSDLLVKSVDTAKFVVSQGDLMPLSTFAVSNSTPGQLYVSWTDNTDNVNAFADDELKILVFDADGFSLSLSEIPYSNRESENITLTDLASDDYAVFGYFTSVSGRVSNTSVARTSGAGQVIAIID